MPNPALDALDRALKLARSRCGDRIPVVAIAGAQGSGKSWLARAFAAETPGAIHLSLDDFYLPAAARRDLSRTAHPLFATRGVPGTHDLVLLNQRLDALLDAGPKSQTLLPAFDKKHDDVQPQESWSTIQGQPNAIIFEGWCLGALPQTEQELTAPINALERDEDPTGAWRDAVNRRLASDYADLFARLDTIVFLKAPSFDVVHAWRCQQEEAMLNRVLTPAERDRIAGFVAYFERISRYMQAGGRRSDLTVILDVGRRVLEVRDSAT